MLLIYNQTASEFPSLYYRNLHAVEFTPSAYQYDTTLPRELFSLATSNHAAFSFQRPTEKRLLVLVKDMSSLKSPVFISNSLQFI